MGLGQPPPLKLAFGFEIDPRTIFLSYPDPCEIHFYTNETKEIPSQPNTRQLPNKLQRNLESRTP
uniref:Putative ovule protein n=1 Tax=Solanum chacoense TaxID=4108 RepID=A0A0V0HSH8_SOLCH